MRALAKKKPIHPVSPKTDLRLLGTWKSDAARTFREWRWKRNVTAKQKKITKSLFGKLEVTYTRNKVVSKLPNRRWESARAYLLLGTDESSAAIVAFGECQVKDRRKYESYGLELLNEFWSQPQIQQIHFDQKNYWVSIGNGRNREFFRKIRRGR